MTRILFLAALLIASTLPASAQGFTLEAAALLARARDNQFAGDRSVDVTGVRDSYLRGEDTLRGRMDFRDARGERRLALTGGGESFEWWSRLYGAEQWRRDGATERLRRIPPHSLKKPALAAAPLSYEDLVRFPLGYFDRFTSCKRLVETDSTYEMTLSLSSLVSTRYSTAEVTLGKRPVLLRRVVFSGPGKPPKSLRVLNYRFESGKYSPSLILFEDGEGLVSLRLAFSPRLAGSPQDKTLAPDGGSPSVRPRDPKIVPREDVEELGEGEEGE